MITTEGKVLIKRYLANQAGPLAAAIAIGVGNTAATLSDETLEFEVERFNVDIVAYDFIDNKLIFKGQLPAAVSGKIYEVGIFTSGTNLIAGNYGSKIITSFDAATEQWDVETFESIVARIGVDALKHTPVASATSTSSLDNIELDLSGYSSADKFVFAYNCDNAFTASVKFRFKVDLSNYYEFNIAAPASGYHITSLAKSSATVTGTPNWEDIGSLSVVTTATGGGTASVEFDGIRIEDVDTVNPEYGMIARKVLSSPYVKVEGQAQEFEYALNINV